ncbi:alpha/beta hydrolase [Autumnicola edwardsiae]|uniref:Alpha/beta hydrolase n=1 Tax=Autumnicola edwardsiae TaxID=3075594 RepID=A0ABU3CTS2_9FLAO|nr:alpha/beta hydrolase [Zunongwangia sp. F297]MDT0649745.1 alpha/beta hydrolase [Zunongwangia sp. F297]
MKKHFLILLLIAATTSVMAQHETLPLWPDEIPNSQKSDEKELSAKDGINWITKVQEPNIAVYLPAKQSATGQAVVICPGGGYAGLAYDWEGTDFAKWLNSKGIAGIVLKYRLPGSKSVKVSYEAPLQDVQRAIRMVRAHSQDWNINKNKVGVIGFSAGGHLASTLGTHFDHQDSFEKDFVDALSARPDFMALIYPVITMDEKFTHQGSKNALLGNNPSKELVENFSNELQVKQNTPPTFLIHATDDESVPVENSLRFYEALKAKKIPVEMHIYPEGGHGFSFGLGKGYLSSWTDRLADWLHGLNEENP